MNALFDENNNDILSFGFQMHQQKGLRSSFKTVHVQLKINQIIYENFFYIQTILQEKHIQLFLKQ